MGVGGAWGGRASHPVSRALRLNPHIMELSQRTNGAVEAVGKDRLKSSLSAPRTGQHVWVCVEGSPILLGLPFKTQKGRHIFSFFPGDLSKLSLTCRV